MRFCRKHGSRVKTADIQQFRKAANNCAVRLHDAKALSEALLFMHNLLLT